MKEVYLYISASKVQNLYSSAKRGRPITNLGLKLKGPFVEADAAVTIDNNDLYKMLRYVRKNLDADAEVLPFQSISGSPPPIISFLSPAAIAVSSNTLWLALAEETTALLLTGSAANMIGGQQLASATPAIDGLFSASLNPVGAAKALDDETDEARSASLTLSFGWQNLRRQAGAGNAVLRKVRGLAIFAGSYPANKTQLRRAGAGNVSRIVVASPIYVAQV